MNSPSKISALDRLSGGLQRLLVTLCMMAIATVGNAAMAQSYPSKPVKIVSAYPAGSGPDAILRIVADKLTTLWGQPVLIDNRPGGNGFISVAVAKQQPKDGSVLFYGDSLLFTAAPYLYSKLRTTPKMISIMCP